MIDEVIHPETPDLETSSADYASRFGGRAGEYLLAMQERAITRAIAGLVPGTALDVGGCHAQSVDTLSERGWAVAVHGTSSECERNLRVVHGKLQYRYLQGQLYALPAPERGFDLVVAIRLLTHVADWRRLVRELCRVAARSVVIDYPSKWGLNALTPLLFSLKKTIEGNTRTYTNFSKAELCREFALHGFECHVQVKQLFLPMVLHRAGKGLAPLRWAETLFRLTGLTALAGSPVILRADRCVRR